MTAHNQWGIADVDEGEDLNEDLEEEEVEAPKQELRGGSRQQQQQRQKRPGAAAAEPTLPKRARTEVEVAHPGTARHGGHANRDLVPMWLQVALNGMRFERFAR